MSLRTFVSGSAIILMAWMVVSFIHHSLPQRYQFNRTAEISRDKGLEPSEVGSKLAVSVSSSQ